MKLKSLEIEGFKSFCDRTVLAFDGNITGVVGPNGCGKSNIVDAIRWVMGEQSARHLRGKQMDDVIFAGTLDRGPSPVSSVELTFLTEGTQTPPQYGDLKEISVGRKLYRSGESEYFINRQPMRLKDVRDLFLGTGVGFNAYSIIEQGSVGAMVTAKPEDRRRVIEEAAGISKFQVRKEAALRKMESTGHNLQRLRDILAELERQKNSLERQAKKAEKFRIIQDELRGLDLSVAAYDYARSRKREEEILAAIKSLDAERVTVENELAAAEARLESDRLQLAGIEREVADRQDDAFAWDNGLAVSESRLASRRDELRRLHLERDEEEERHATLLTHENAVATALTAAVLESCLTDMTATAALETARVAEANEARVRALAQEVFAGLESARVAEREAVQALSGLERDRSQLLERREQLDSRRGEDAEKLAALTSRSRTLDRLLGEAQEGLNAVHQLKLELTQKGGDLTNELGLAEERLAHEQADLKILHEELLARKSRLTSLEELERNFEGYHDGPRALLERKRAGENPSIIGTVADFIETAPEYEGAVSAVLSERAQCLIVSQPFEAAECAQYLRCTDSGRGAFVALSITGADTADAVEPVGNLVGVRGVISDFVRFKPGYEGLSRVLFGDTLLSDGLDQAMEAWQVSRQAVATMDGEFIAADGIITGGSFEKTSKALLAKKREIKELNLRVEELVAKVAGREADMQDLSGNLKTMQAELEGIRSTTHAEEVRLATQESDLNHARKELSAVNEERQTLSRRILESESALSNIVADLERIEAGIVTERTKAEGAAATVIARREEEEFHRVRLGASQEALTQAKIELAKAEQGKAHRDAEITRLLDESIAGRHVRLTSGERSALLDRRLIFIEDRIAFAEKNLVRLMSGKALRDKAYREKKAEHDELYNELIREDAALRDLRQRAGGLKDELNAHTVTLTELRALLTRVSEQIFERYRLSLSEVYREHAVDLAAEEYADRTARADELRGQLARAGGVNLGAIDELREVADRFDFLNRQKIDLEESLASLEQAIQKINRTTRERFRDTFELINGKFSQLFPKLFQGGEAHLKLSDPDNLLETGVDIIAQPPGKKLQSITLLSGGEKALTAVSLLFAIFLIKPSPFCLLDEVDAPLDDANVDRYNDIVSEMSARTQFVVITHNKRTMQMTEALFGVTMERAGISRLVSVRLD